MTDQIVSTNKTFTIQAQHVTMLETLEGLTGRNKSELVRLGIEAIYAQAMPASAKEPTIIKLPEAA